MSITTFPGSLKETVYPSSAGALNITDNVLNSYPTASNGVPGVACSAASWTEVIPASTITTKIYIYRIVGTAVAAKELKVGTGSGGSEVEVAHLYGFETGYVGGDTIGINTVHSVYEFPIPLEVDANVRVAVDANDTVRICYAIPSLIAGKTTAKTSYQDYIGTASPVSSGTANTFGSWAEVTASTSARFVISSIVVSAIYTHDFAGPGHQAVNAMVEIAIDESTIIKVPFSWDYGDVTSGNREHKVARMLAFPIMYIVPASSIIDVRAADSVATAYTYTVYVNGYNYPLR